MYILPGNINVCISVENTRVYIDLHIIHSILEVNEFLLLTRGEVVSDVCLFACLRLI